MPKLARRTIIFFLAMGLVCAFVISAAYFHFSVRKRLDVDRVADYTVEELIDGLQDVESQGLGTHSTAWADGFLASDEEPQFRGGVLGSAKPNVSPVMRELVRRGLSALPGLMDHLSDSRPTRLVINSQFGGMWHSSEYESRYAGKEKQPLGVNKGREDELWIDREYRVRVGDLCYVVIGQIVNRRMNVVRYQPTACIVINSPVETPALADAVRKDWEGLSKEQHRESLVRDALHGSHYGVPAALVRLFFYYPEDAAPLATRFLHRPFYDHWKVRLFIKGKLIEGQTPAEWKKAVAAFTAENGNAAAEVLPNYLHKFVIENTADRGEEFAAAREMIKKVLVALYPNFDPNQEDLFINAVTEQDQIRLIEGLLSIQSDALDAGTTHVFRKIDLNRYDKADRIYADDLAIACMDRLIGKGLDDELRVYCEGRIEELEVAQRSYAEEQRLEPLRKRLNRIRNEH